MKISSIPHIYRNIKRGSEIVSVLSRHGLADWIARLNIDALKDALKARDGESIARQTWESRVRLALQDLGPTFIKLGQLMSTRPDLVGAALAEELKKLQTDVRADPPETARRIIETELGQPLDQIFAEFEEQPVASASIGQVHRARLLTGERVVVKVQHAGIQSTVEEDLDVRAGLAALAERIPELQVYRPSLVVAEMARSLRRELDFGREERNLQQFSQLFADSAAVHIPVTYSEYCTPRVLTMELLEGVKLAAADQLTAAGFDLDELARRGADIYLEMIFTHGFYHADPHPGNILLLPGNRIGLLDFGMVGRIDEQLREDIEDMLMSIVNRDVPMLAAILRKIGNTPADLDQGAFANDVADFVGHFASQPIERFDVSGALLEMMNLIRRYHITLPPQAAMLIKTLVTLDGTAKLLSPRFNLIEVMQPFHRKLLFARLSPARHMKKMRRIAFQLQQLGEVLPQKILDILDQVQSGKFDVHLDHRRLGPSVNRLVLGMLTSALFLGSSLMLSQQVPPLLFNTEQPLWFGLYRVSILGLLGVIASLVMGLRLFWAIYRSGHLEKPD